MCLVYGGGKRHLTDWRSVAVSAKNHISKSPESRARSGQLQRRVGRARSVGYRIPIAQTNCAPALYHAWVRSRTEAGRTAGEAFWLRGGCARFGALS